ncbi:MAG TPA: glycine betaine ABC transporter substrate-binding protein [Candidatus Baltobacteraceae bacterium]|jgi:osmoprotectant transport system substrate-binding protein|nr:glycine betaine ABC transporter substrate-binding protein [Candidatus Baltobacteraceae bacterium]
MTLTRKRSLALIGAALTLPSCGGGDRNVLKAGSKNFGENIIVAEIYAAALERAGLHVERRMNLGSTQIATEAMVRGDIDLYPEYTGTGLIDVLHHTPVRSASEVYAIVKREYARRYGITWLAPSPVNDSQALAVTASLAEKMQLRTLSRCAVLASGLSLAAIPEFVSRADALPGLQRFYGGFHFKSVRTYAIGLQYDALTRGDADVATAFTTDSQIDTDHLVLLSDDKHFWPPYNIAPLVRNTALRAHPQAQAVLNRISPLLTDAAVRRFNEAYNLAHADPAQIAQQFLKEHAH